MRDIVVTLVILGLLPLAFKRPVVGVYLWAWIGYMNPHRLCWGFAQDMPFAMLVALVTLSGLLVNKEEAKKIPWTRESILLAIFVAWMLFTTIFALYPVFAWEQMEKIAKIQLMVFVTMMLINTKQRLIVLVWIMALSIGFYGVKGGIFTIVHGGVYRVQGPMNTFIGGNNEIALALIMTIPLLRFCALQAPKWWMRLGMSAATLLSGIAVIGSQSRGAVVGIAAMGVFLWLKSRKKLLTLMAIAFIAVSALAIMPQQWYDRIATIQTYESDRSALGRISAWWTAYNLAKDRFTGGGFETFRERVFRQYSPTPQYVHDVHSIYFEVMGEHGFLGLAIFLALAGFTWLTASRIIRATKKDLERKWMADLAAMVQVSMIGYAAAGAFLGLAYFDFYYGLITIVVVLRMLVFGEKATARRPTPVGTARTLLAEKALASPGKHGEQHTE